jgi:hypothetical protein
MKTINVDVPEDIAIRYLNMPPSEQLSVSKEFIRILEKRNGLREIMDDMSEQAKKNGLTPELLEELLKDE